MQSKGGRKEKAFKKDKKGGVEEKRDSGGNRGKRGLLPTRPDTRMGGLYTSPQVSYMRPFSSLSMLADAGGYACMWQ